MSSIKPSYRPLELRENAQFRETLEFTQDGAILDFTGAVFSCEIRKGKSVDSELLYTVPITVDILTGKVTRKIPKNICASLKGKAAFCDLKVVWSNGDDDILTEGPIQVSGGVTE